FVDYDSGFVPRPLSRLLSDEGDEPAVGRPLETLNRRLVRGQLNRLAAQRIDHEDLRAGFAVSAPFRQKSQSTRVGRPARRVVAPRVRGQTNGLPQLVDHPDVGIEPVVLAVPRVD